MIKKTKIIFITIFLLIFLAGADSALMAQDKAHLPTFRIRNLSGELFDSRKHLGKPLVLSFFFTRCPPCIKEMPALYEFMLQEGRLEQLLFVDPYVKSLEINEVPVARVTFNHGSSQLSDEDVRKIKEVANLIIQNEKMPTFFNILY